MPEMTFHLNELIAAVSFLLGGGGLGTVIAKKKGWITFGKPVERRTCPALAESLVKECPDHPSIVLGMTNITSEISSLKAGQVDVFNLLRATDRKVERLVGFHQGNNGVNLGGGN